MDNAKTFALCWRMALKDGQLNRSEQMVLDTIGEELGLTPEEQLAARDMLGPSLKASELPKDLLGREALIRLMVRVGWADNVIQPAEEMFLVKIGEAMSMDLEKINKIVVQLSPENELVELKEIESLRRKDFEAYMVADQARLIENSPGLFDFGIAVETDAKEDRSVEESLVVAITLIIATTVSGGFLVSKVGPVIYGVLTDKEMWNQTGEYAQLQLIMVFIWWVLVGVIGSILFLIASYYCVVYFFVGLKAFGKALRASDASSR